MNSSALSGRLFTAIAGTVLVLSTAGKGEVPKLPAGVAPQERESAVGKTLIGEHWNSKERGAKAAASKALTASRVAKARTVPAAPKVEKKAPPAKEAEESLRAVAAKLWVSGQAEEADAIENAVRGIMRDLPVKGRSARAKYVARIVPTHRTGADYQQDLELLKKAVSAGLGPKHPKVMALTEAVRLEWRALQELQNAAAAEAASARRAEPVKESDQAGDNLPWGVALPGRNGLAYSPYTPERSVVDVTGFKKGSKVKCPYTGNFFQVP
jgi:hypothetical protein